MGQALHQEKKFILFSLLTGKYGILGIIISVIIIGYVISKTLKIIRKNNISSYDEFLDIILGGIKLKNIDVKLILNFIINIFLLITFFVMCAGFAAYFKQELGINEIIISLFISIFCYFILNKNIKGVFLLNSILMPMIIIVLVILGVKVFNVNVNIDEGSSNFKWILNAILYASYNSITLISILIPMKKYINSKKDIFKIVFMCIFIILFLSLIIFALLLSIDADIGKIELPTVYAAKSFGIVYKYLYGIIILGAIVTTAISSAYGFLNNVSKTKESYKRNNLIICFLSIFVCLFGFSNLVNLLYPIFGFLGLIQLILISTKNLY